MLEMLRSDAIDNFCLMVHTNEPKVRTQRVEWSIFISFIHFQRKSRLKNVYVHEEEPTVYFFTLLVTQKK